MASPFRSKQLQFTPIVALAQGVDDLRQPAIEVIPAGGQQRQYPLHRLVHRRADEFLLRLAGIEPGVAFFDAVGQDGKAEASGVLACGVARLYFGVMLGA